MLPGVLGAGVAQINLLADVFFASLLPAGAVSYLYYADRLNQLPLGVIGIAVGTALLPLLARQIRAGEAEAALASQNRALELALLLTLPCAVGLAVLSLPIMQVLFERGAFGAADAPATAQALAAYALGLPAYVLVKVLVPGFFARKDTRTPVKIAVVCLIANIVFILVAALAARPCRHRARDRARGLAERRPARLWPAPRGLSAAGCAPASVACRGSCWRASRWVRGSGCCSPGWRRCRRAWRWRCSLVAGGTIFAVLAQLSGAMALGEVKAAICPAQGRDAPALTARRSSP